MGALPSRETHQRGLYSHRHGRNRRSEIILIPLTRDFFPSPDCPLFQHLYNARYRRTAKYYFRALRSTETSRESDYFCTSSKLSEPEEFAAFDAERRKEQQQKKTHQLQRSGTVPHPHAGAAAANTGKEADGKAEERVVRPAVVDDYAYQSFTDTLEGLYSVLIAENDLCLYDTDEQLRAAYASQVRHQRHEWEKMSRRYQQNAANPSSNPPKKRAAGSPSDGVSEGVLWPEMPSTFENVPFDAFLSGYAAAKRYMKGKRLHTQENADVDDDGEDSCDDDNDDAETGEAAGARPRDGGTGTGTGSAAKQRRKCKHIVSPAAYYLHPIPCAIASRWDSNKPPPVDDPLYVPFEGFHVKIMGMFGTFPSTVVFRSEHEGGDDDNDAEGNADSGSARPKKGAPPRSGGSGGRPFPRKEGNPGGDSKDAGGTRVRRHTRSSSSSSSNKAAAKDFDKYLEMESEQHLLKGTMFIDKDVGDQILGNMVMLATHMYVRQCVRAHIHPRYMPMMPFFLRFPLSNIPMLQFIREFRVRLRTLLEAGTAKSGQKPVHVGMSGFNPMDIAEAHDQQRAKWEEEGYLFEDDIPDVLADTDALFMQASEAHAISFTSHRTSINTNEGGRFPIFMLSGFNVQNTPLRHPALNETGHTPAYHSHAAPPQQQQPQSEGAKQAMVPPPPPPPPPPFPGPPQGGGSGAAAAFQNGPGTPVFDFRNPAAGQVPSSSPTTSSAPAQLPQMSTIASETHKSMLLTRRKNRFRMWIEDGHVCLWASAAYARRACLLLAQQLNTTVDSHSVPEQRAWQLRGLLHSGACVPTPRTVNDVLVVAEDIPSAGLWQGDVLRCCSREEMQAMRQHQPLPLPCRSAAESGLTGSPTTTTSPHSASSLPASSTAALASATPPTAAAAHGTSANANAGLGAIGSALHKDTSGFIGAPVGLESPLMGADSGEGDGHASFTSNHASNPLMQEQAPAPANAFWVRAAGGLDDSYTNISDSNMPPNPKMAKQLQQAAQQRAKKLAAAAAALSRLHAGALGGAPGQGKGGSGGALGGLAIPGSHNSSDSAAVAAAAAASLALSMASDFLEIDRREGTLNLEEVVLSWVRVMSMLSREGSSEAEGDWVRDPSGSPVRIDRFVFRRLEFEGVRFFIGVTPRFVGQQRRIEKVLGEVYAMEKRASKQQQQSQAPLPLQLSPSLQSASPQQQHRMASAFSSIGAEAALSSRNSCGKSNSSSNDNKQKKKLAAAVLASKGLADFASSSSSDGEAEEDHEDVLERMGFGPRRLREAFERSTAAHSNKNNNNDSDPQHQTSPSTLVPAVAAGSEETKAATSHHGGGENDQDLLEKFDYQNYLLTEDEAH